MRAMEATRERPPLRSARVAIDFLLLAAAAIMAGLVTAAVAATVVILLSGAAQASTRSGEEIPLHAAGSGSLMLKAAPGLYRALPTLKTDVYIRATGIVARAYVRQDFQNTTDGWIEAVYV